MSKSGVQNKNKMVVMKPNTPVATALVKMPLAAMTLMCSVSFASDAPEAALTDLALTVSSAM